MKIGTLAAALAGGIVMFLLGFLFFGILFSDYFRANMVEYPGLMKDPPVIWAIFLFNFAWAWLIAWITDRSGLGGWAEGAKVGAIVMFVLGVGMDIQYYAFMNVHKALAPMLAQILILTVMGAVVGAVIGFVLDFFNKRATTA